MPSGSTTALLLIAGLLLGAGDAGATCDAVPGTPGRFRGVRGIADRPYAGPGDVVTITLDPACDTGPALSPDAGHVVSIVFQPHTGPAHAIVVAPSCGGVAAMRLACETALGDGVAICVPGAEAGLQVDTRDGVARLRFRFPDTDAVLGAPNDGRTLAGPVAIAVTRPGEALPCALAQGGCRTQPGTLACLDELFLDDGACGGVPHPVFDHFTALPPANDFGGLCTDPTPPCTGDATEVRAALDRTGNLLVPMDWRRVLVRRADVPVPRLLRGAIRLEAFAGTGAGVLVPDAAALGAFSVQGVALPPIFTPQRDPDALDRLTLFGSADAPAGVLRIARGATCDAGPAAGSPCRRDAECAPGRCAGGLFDFRDRVFEGVGPLVLRRGGCLGGSRSLMACAAAAECPGGDCVTFAAEAADPVPLDGLNTAGPGFAFVVNERLVDDDRNGDGDATDDVVQLVDATSGRALPIGDAAPGRATVRLHEAPFSRAALVAAGDTVAFLEPEALGGHVDRNGDGDAVDTILRAYRLAGDTATDLTGGTAIVADGAPLVQGASIAIAGERLWFRTQEAAAARRTTTVVSLDHGGEPVSDACQITSPQAVSADGRFVAFLSTAADITPDDIDCEPSGLCRDAFLLDRDADDDGRFDESGATTVTRASAAEPFAPATVAAVSADGRTTAFVSSAATLVPGDDNGLPDAFVVDRDTDLVARVSVGSLGEEADLGVLDTAGAIAVSADGMIVAFASAATRLVPGDLNDLTDVFVHDRRTSDTTRVSVGSGGLEANGPSFIRTLSAVSVSGDGRFVAFDSDATNLVPGDTNGESDIFVHDRLTGATRRVSVGIRGEQANAGSRAPVLAPDGSAVAFTSVATNLVPGTTRGFYALFVHDLASEATTVAGIASDGTPADGPSSQPAFSADGRYVAFVSEATALVPDDDNGIPDVFVHDRLTGLTERVSLTAAGGQVPRLANTAESTSPALRGDGQSAVFVCTEDLVPGVQRHRAIFARTPDPDDTASDLTGDGRHDATLLRSLDLTATPGATPRTLCPATQVAVAGDMAVFLRPEAEGDAPSCPAGPDLNGDDDTADTVVHRVVGDGTVENLGVAATAVALSAERLAALVSEAAQGEVDLNGDGDTDDLVLHVRPSTGDGAWTNVGLAADVIEARGDAVIAVVPEAGQRDDLDGDGDQLDRVLHRVDGDGTTHNLALAVEEFVASDTLVAFRTREAAHGGRDLNGDGDAGDDVLFVWDLVHGVMRATGQAVTPCRFEACDPRLPYRPLTTTVRFLTLEAAQDADLNGDGDTDDLVLQTFNVRAGDAGAGRTVVEPAAGASRTIAAVGAGFCTTTGAACASDDVCPTGDRCIVPPGRCVADTGVPCHPGAPAACAPSEFCGSDPGRLVSTCRRRGGECRADGDCVTNERCTGNGQDLQRIAAPLAAGTTAGATVPAVGRCVDPSDDTPGTPCRIDEECPLPSICRADLVSAALTDRDGDELPDVIDVCPDIADPTQPDADADGIGDACDRRTAGNGVREAGEECDGIDDAVCRGQCQPNATCLCANESPEGSRARLSDRRRTSLFVARATLHLPEYTGEPLLVRVNDASGRLVASGSAEAFEGRARRIWRAGVLSPGLQKVHLSSRPGGRVRLYLRARGWLPDDAVAPLRLTVTIGDQCVAFTGRVDTTTTTTLASPTTSSTSTSTTTSTTTTTLAAGCCAAHRMVIETVAGGEFRLGALPPITLPAGTRMVFDVGPPDAQCRHSVTIPPDGFDMKPACVGFVPLTSRILARGCAAGDALGRGTAWDGGAAAPDPDVSIAADTRDGVCNPPGQACTQQERGAANNALGVQRTTFGDTVPNAPGLHLSVALPVVQHTWDVREEAGAPPVCPDTDGIGRVEENVNKTYGLLRLTTGRARASFADLNADGCRSLGADPGTERVVDGAPAPGPCCVVGQTLQLAAIAPEFTAGFIGDVIGSATLPARVVACEPAREAASCDALVGGGRVVTAISADTDGAQGVFPVAGDRLLAVGRAYGDAGWTLGLTRYDATGFLDRTFGLDGSGRAIVRFGTEMEFHAVAADGAGRILSTGVVRNGVGGASDGAIARVLTDGRADDTFAGAGQAVLARAGYDELYAVAADREGRVVAAGTTAGAGEDVLVVRYTADGRLDETFGATGVTTTDFSVGLGAGAAHDRAFAAAVDATGRIVVGGRVAATTRNRFTIDGRFAVARYRDDGQLDATFGEGGLAVTTTGPFGGRVRALAPLADGGLVAVGAAITTDYGVAEMAVVRYDAGGLPVAAFATGGILRTTALLGQAEALAVTVLPGGKLLVGGWAQPPGDVTPAGERVVPFHRWVLARLDLATGALDTAFGHDGFAFASFGGLSDEIQALLPLADGRILAGGSYDPNGTFGYESDFALARYLADGRLDPTFGGECSWEVEPRTIPLP